MRNDFLGDTISYHVGRADGSSTFVAFDHSLISERVQDRIADRLALRKRELYLCRAQLDREPGGRLKIVPRLKQVGFQLDVPDLLVVHGEAITARDLVVAINRDNEVVQKALQDFATAGKHARQAVKNSRIRKAKRQRDRKQGEFWNEENER